MKRNSSEQTEIDRTATHIVEGHLLPAKWVKFDIKPDIKIDFHIETRYQIEKEVTQSLSGNRVWIQQKGRKQVKLKGNFAVCTKIKTEDIAYWVDRCHTAAFLFLVDIKSRECWWLFIQRYILEEMPEDQRYQWRKQKSITIYIPLNQTLKQLDSFETAMLEARRYMARLTPASIQNAVNSQIAQLKSLDPEVNVEVHLTNDNTVSFRLTATNPARPFSLKFNPASERYTRLRQEVIDKGLPVDYQPGEITFFGSPIFHSDWFAEMRRLQVARISHNDVHLLIASTDGTPPAEIKFSNATIESGVNEFRIDGRLWEGLATLRGTVVRDTNMQRMSFRIDLTSWKGHRVSGLRYFNQLFAFVKATLKGGTVEIYAEQLDQRHLIGSAPALKETSRQRWESMAVLLQFIENLQLIERRFNAALNVPAVFLPKDFELVNDILNSTDYSSFPAPEWTATTQLEDVPETTLIQLKSDPTSLSGRTVLRKPAVDIELFGVILHIPAHRYITTNVVARVLEADGSDAITIGWNGTSTTVLTIEPDDGVALSDIPNSPTSTIFTK